MKKFWSQSLEIKSIVISSLVTLLGFGGTAFLFWLQHYEIPLGILVGGLVVILSWLFLYLIKKKGNHHVKLEIALIYVRLGVIVLLTTLFVVLEITLSLVIVSPIALVASYLVISLLTLLAYIQKGEENV